MVSVYFPNSPLFGYVSSFIGRCVGFFSTSDQLGGRFLIVFFTSLSNKKEILFEGLRSRSRASLLSGVRYGDGSGKASLHL